MRLCNHARLVSASHSRPPSVFSAIRFPDLLITVAAWPAECSSATCFPDLLITVAPSPAERFSSHLFPRFPARPPGHRLALRAARLIPGLRGMDGVAWRSLRILLLALGRWLGLEALEVRGPAPEVPRHVLL